MQQFAALLMSSLIAAAGLAPTAPQPQRAAGSVPVAEVYVAEMDADWNVSREVRLPCSTEDGCKIELPGTDAHALKLHVRFDGLRGGAMAVSSALEDADGRATVQPAALLTLDRAGFGAAHFDTSGLAAAEGQRVVMMAVQLKGWTAPVGEPAGGAHI